MRFLSLYRFSALLTLSLVTVLLGQMAHADWVGAGRWGTDTRWRYVQPGTWVLDQDADAGRAAIHAEGSNHDTHLAVSCTAETRSGRLTFGGYRGFDLIQPRAVQEPPVTAWMNFELDGTRLGIEMRYDPLAGLWHSAAMLDATVLEAFALGRRLTVSTPDGVELAQYRLQRGRAADRGLRETCGY